MTKRPDAIYKIYNDWRKRSISGQDINFECCPWFEVNGSWCRQNDRMTRISIAADGQVTLTYDHKNWS